MDLENKLVAGGTCLGTFWAGEADSVLDAARAWRNLRNQFQKRDYSLMFFIYYLRSTYSVAYDSAASHTIAQ